MGSFLKNAASFIRIFLWVLSILGSLLGGLVLIVGILVANGAPQEAAVAAIGVALAVIPYCLARSASEFNREPEPTPLEPTPLVRMIDTSNRTPESSAGELPAKDRRGEESHKKCEADEMVLHEIDNQLKNITAALV